MRKTIIGGLALLAFCGQAQAFDCQEPSVPAVAVICSNPDLIKLTQERQRAFAEAKARAKGEALRALIEDQRRWVGEYPKSCGLADQSKPPATIDKGMQECFKRAGEERTAYLRQYAQPEAAASAPAPASTPQAEASKPAPQAEASKSPPRSPASGNAYHLKFTFACQSAGKLQEVLRALEHNDYAYPLNQTDCLPVPEGREAALLSVEGKVAKVRLCSTDAGCTDVYADAGSVLNAAGQPVGK
jgi:uncharacterized protein YecT (DUF1311 family)